MKDSCECKTMEDRQGKMHAVRNVFRRGGPKLEQMGRRTKDEDLAEAEATRTALAELYALWRAPHAASLKHLMVLSWMPSLGLAKMQVQRGKLWRSMGFTHGKDHYFYVEEVVYLMQRASASVLDVESGMELSVQEIMMLMIEMGVTMERYMAYVHLRRGGYVVTRYPALWTMEKSAPIESYGQRLGSSWTKSCWFPAYVQVDKHVWTGQSIDSKEKRNESRARENHAKRKRGLKHASRHEGGLESLHFNKKIGSWWPKADQHHPWLGLGPDQLPSTPKLSVTFRNKAVTRWNHPPSYPVYCCADKIAGEGLIMFDVYQPNNQFSRRACGDPSFHLCVAEGDFPDHNDLQSAVSLDDVDLKIAVVDSGAILYFSVQEIVLPHL